MPSKKLAGTLKKFRTAFSDQPGKANGFASFIGNWEFED
jgi:hypothetical protein